MQQLFFMSTAVSVHAFTISAACLPYALSSKYRPLARGPGRFQPNRASTLSPKMNGLAPKRSAQAIQIIFWPHISTYVYCSTHQWNSNQIDLGYDGPLSYSKGLISQRFRATRKSVATLSLCALLVALAPSTCFNVRFWVRYRAYTWQRQRR